MGFSSRPPIDLLGPQCLTFRVENRTISQSENTNESSGRYSLRALRRALAVLGEFQEGPTHMSLTEISERVGEPVTVVFRILKTLTETGFLEIEERTKRY